MWSDNTQRKGLESIHAIALHSPTPGSFPVNPINDQPSVTNYVSLCTSHCLAPFFPLGFGRGSRTDIADKSSPSKETLRAENTTRLNDTGQERRRTADWRVTHSCRRRALHTRTASSSVLMTGLPFLVLVTRKFTNFSPAEGGGEGCMNIRGTHNVRLR